MNLFFTKLDSCIYMYVYVAWLVVDVFDVSQ